MNKLSLVGMQLPEKYKENFDVSNEDEGPPDEGPPDEGPPDEGPPDEGPPDEGPPDEGPPDEGPSLKTSKFSLYFSSSCIPNNESLLYNLSMLS
jgi:hypothetical protein